MSSDGAQPCCQPPFIFRLNDNGQGPDLVRQVFMERGWFEFDETSQEEYDWNVWWKTSRFRQCDYDQILPWQRLNHYPKTTMITRKDSLARNLKRMKGVYGATVFNFSPLAYNVPNDYTRFVAECSMHKQNDSDQAQFWICKPADMSRGRGIFIFRDLNDLQYDCSAVVQKYITNPMLIAGYKFDLRIYVSVTSFHPLTVYIYQEGLARFSTEKFDLSTLSNVFSHLTNTSINKHSPSYTTDKERVGPGCKWTLTQLRQYLHQMNIDDKALWARVKTIIILTLLAQVPQVPKITNCFELYGFDILIDDKLKPWLLEVNFSPALGADCQTDVIVKKPLLHDIIEMLNLSESDAERGGDDFKQRRIDRVYGQRMSSIATPRRRPSSSRQQKKRGKLPSINLNSSMNSSGSVSRENSNLSNEQTADSENEVFIPVVRAGCGLPSVQHPESPVRRPNSCDNYSSAESLSSVVGDQSGGPSHPVTDTSMQKNRRTVKPLQSLPRSGLVKKPPTAPTPVDQVMKRSDSKTSLKNLDVKPPNLHTITEGKVHLNATVDDCDIKEPPTRGISDIKSKHSSAENLCMESISDESIERQVQLIEQRKELNSEHRKKLNRDTRRTSGAISTTSITAVDKRSASFISNNSSNSSASCPGEEDGISPSPRMSSPPKQKYSRLNRISIRQKINPSSPLRNTRPPPASRTYGGYQVNSHRNLDAGAISVRQIGTQDQSAKHASKFPSKQIGDFFLVYPYNEASRRACIPSLDIRSAIRETQLHLKQQLNTIHGATKKANKQKVMINAKHHYQIPIEEPTTLWGPLRAPPPED